MPPDLAVLRGNCFGQCDPDPFDDQSLHLLAADMGGRLLAACRLRVHNDGGSLANGYTGQFYALDRLSAIGMPLIELGRLCTAAGEAPALALRLIWAGIADLTRHWRAKAIFGCASFHGADVERHRAALGHLAAQYCDERGRDSRAIVAAPLKVALQTDRDAVTPVLPPLLRSYLALGAWVGPDAVLDPVLDTLHVLTVLEIDRIPAGRRRALAAFVAAAGGHPVDEAGHSA